MMAGAAEPMMLFRQEHLHSVLNCAHVSDSPLTITPTCVDEGAAATPLSFGQSLAAL